MRTPNSKSLARKVESGLHGAGAATYVCGRGRRTPALEKMQINHRIAYTRDSHQVLPVRPARRLGSVRSANKVDDCLWPYVFPEHISHPASDYIIYDMLYIHSFLFKDGWCGALLFLAPHQR